MRIRIRIQQLKLMRIHADPDPKPCIAVLYFCAYIPLISTDPSLYTGSGCWRGRGGWPWYSSPPPPFPISLLLNQDDQEVVWGGGGGGILLTDHTQHESSHFKRLASHILYMPVNFMNMNKLLELLPVAGLLVQISIRIWALHPWVFFAEQQRCVCKWRGLLYFPARTSNIFVLQNLLYQFLSILT